MVTDRRKATGKEPVKQLKLKKESLRDLDGKNRGKEVKGGSGSPYCTIPTRPREG
jgi:hypothetical protein